MKGMRCTIEIEWRIYGMFDYFASGKFCRFRQRIVSEEMNSVLINWCKTWKTIFVWTDRNGILLGDEDQTIKLNWPKMAVNEKWTDRIGCAPKQSLNTQSWDLIVNPSVQQYSPPTAYSVATFMSLTSISILSNIHGVLTQVSSHWLRLQTKVTLHTSTKLHIPNSTQLKSTQFHQKSPLFHPSKFNSKNCAFGEH